MYSVYFSEFIKTIFLFRKNDSKLTRTRQFPRTLNNVLNARSFVIILHVSRTTGIKTSLLTKHITYYGRNTF